jgi:hypothetical protein
LLVGVVQRCEGCSIGMQEGRQHEHPLPPSCRLLERMDLRAGAMAAAWLRKHGVEVVLGERVVDRKEVGC